MEKSICLQIANIEQIYVSREHHSTEDSVRTNPVLNLITKAGERIEMHRGTSEHLVEVFVSVRKALLRSLKIPVEPIAGEAEDVRWSVNQDIDTPATCYCCGVSVNPGPFCGHCGSAYPQASVDSMTAPVVSFSTRCSVNKVQDGIAITWRWGTVGSRNLLWFAIAWNIIVLTISSGAARVADAQFHAILVFFLLIGVGLAVVALTMHYNVTDIRATTYGIQIKDHPVPMPRRRHFALNEIDAVAATMQSKLDKKKVLRFPVLEITTRDGQQHRVVKGFQEAEFGDIELMAREIRSVLGRT